jgi:hypothetical protein
LLVNLFGNWRECIPIKMPPTISVVLAHVVLARVLLADIVLKYDALLKPFEVDTS